MSTNVPAIGGPNRWILPAAAGLVLLSFVAAIFLGIVDLPARDVLSALTGSGSREARSIVLDIRLPGQSGLEFQEVLAKSDLPRSVVLISAHVDVPMAVRAMKAGAIDVLSKPVREQDLLDAVNRAIANDAARRDEKAAKAATQARYMTLTERERQILTLVIAGKLNKQIAAELQLAEPTVKLHRGHMMRKMKATSVAHLVKLAGDLL